MAAREAMLRSDLIPGDLRRVFPICTPELLRLGQLRRGARAAAPGRAQPAARRADDDPGGVGERRRRWTPQRRDFYRFHACLMEPWDGPASVAFTDGTVVGAVLDRNGLRPGRWWRTRDGLVVLASEAGVLDVDPSEVVAKGRLQPGRMFLVDTGAGRIIEDDEIKKELAGAAAVRRLAARRPDAPGRRCPTREHIVYTHDSVQRRQQTFGYTEEELQDPARADGADRAPSRSARWARTPRSRC